MKILIVNGSLGGAGGNTARLLKGLERAFAARAELRYVHLNEEKSLPDLMSDLGWADGFVFSTGTYWDSWGSPLQSFFEKITPTEGTDLWLGKPAAVAVTMHAVGGKGVLSRLQGVLNTLGCSIPPMSGIVYSLSNQLALKADSEFAADFWQPDDLAPIAENLILAMGSNVKYRAWPVDREDPHRRWISD
ncbi:MAG: hypothetical protein EOP11_03565 [Proteobacteria bacterium]|nr:MAG: hypothetical protein EOP11_03565 [Pseudomonadota bacterium]